MLINIEWFIEKTLLFTTPTARKNQKDKILRSSREFSI